MALSRYSIEIKKAGKDVGQGVAKRLIQLLVEGQLKDLRIDAFSDFRSTLLTRQNLNNNLIFDVKHRSEAEMEVDPNAQQHEVRLEPSGIT